VLPKDNEKDLADIPQEILASLTVHFVETMDEVLQIALERPIVPIEHVAVPVVAVAEGFAAGSEKDTSLTN
jgi:ATP-dependent Lon protease